MERYFKNLLIALLGRNPYQLELERKTNEYELTAEEVERQRDQIYLLEARLATLQRDVQGFQNLTENLRKRVTDKDIALDGLRRDKAECVQKLKAAHAKELNEQIARHRWEMDTLRDEHQRELVDRHEEYEEKLSDMRSDLNATLEQLQKVNKGIAREMLAQSMLDKTNNSLQDLVTAMKRGDVDMMMMAVEYLEWSNPLSQIAQLYTQLLKRKNELVERLHFTERSADDDNVNFD